MKKTRKLFILMGTTPNVSNVIGELQFKGTTIIEEPPSKSSIYEVYNNNKSVICSSEFAGIEMFHEAPIYIGVGNDSNSNLTDYINISKGDVATQFQNIAIRHNCDIGDHRTNSSGLNGMPTARDCVYCKILNNQISGQERIVYQSKNFFVIPTLGQFIKGYLLIIPNKHVMSMAELSDSLIKEFYEVLEDVEYMLKLTYDTTNFLVWENGTGHSGKGKAKDSIVHSHIHIAPSKLLMDEIIAKSKFDFDNVELGNLSNYSNDSYLLICDDETKKWWINNNNKMYIPRQYIRQILAEEHNIPEKEDAWNWRTHPYKELMKETVGDIVEALKKNWNSIPERIKQNTKNHIN